MNKKIISNKYFRALFNFVVQKKEINNCKEELEYIKDIFKKNEKLLEFFKNEFLSLDNRFEMIDSIFCNFSQYIKNFLKILVKKKIINYFLYSFDYFLYLYNCSNSLINGIVFSTYKLNQEQILLIEKVIKNKKFKNIKLENKIDKSLINGIKIIIDNKVYNYSIANDIDMLKNKLMS